MFTRRGAFGEAVAVGPNCGGPKRQYLESACLRMIERRSFPRCSLLVGMVIRNRHNEIETDTNVNIILWIGGNLFIEHLNHADNIVKILFRCIK